jgi:hypothetical protein
MIFDLLPIESLHFALLKHPINEFSEGGVHLTWKFYGLVKNFWLKFLDC